MSSFSGSATEASTAMIATVMTSSISVKPREASETRGVALIAALA